MGATLTRGYTFGATEQVTATKLHTLIDSATIAGIVNSEIAAGAGIQDAKLAQIATSAKVKGTALIELDSIPAGAGDIPVANIDTGTTANKIVILDGDAKLPAVDGSQLTDIKPSDLAIASQARGDILYFDGTNWKRLAKGTDGQYLKIGANDPTWAAVSAGGKQLYTSGSGNWTCPAGVTQIFYTIQAGGGGGAGGADTNAGGGGGAGACKIRVPLTTTPENNYAYVVGAGGQGGRWTVQNPTAGGSSSFNSDSVSGGGRGGTVSSKEYGEAGGVGGDRYSGSKDATSASPSVPGTGLGGGNGGTSQGNTYSGAGGGSNFGTGGAGTNGSGNGNAGTGYGSGGSGSSQGSTATYIGGAGAGGFVLIEW